MGRFRLLENSCLRDQAVVNATAFFGGGAGSFRISAIFYSFVRAGGNTSPVRERVVNGSVNGIVLCCAFAPKGCRASGLVVVADSGLTDPQSCSHSSLVIRA